MSVPHTTTLRLALVEATKKGWRLFQNAVGLGFVGRVMNEYNTSGSTPMHVTVLGPSRRVHFGLTPGSFDLVGWRPVVVTPDMVGTTIAQFATVDAKTAGYERLSPEQKIWARAVQTAGGFAAVAMRVDGGRVAIAEILEEKS